MGLVVTGKQMQLLDSTAIKKGYTSEKALIKSAARAAAGVIARLVPPVGRLVFLCGPGNNGADGMGVASILAGWGHQVVVLVYGGSFSEAMQSAIGSYLGEMHRLTADAVSPYLNRDSVFVDALFGVGLSRDVPDDLVDIISAINAQKLDVVAIDIPTGVRADDGTIAGVALKAFATVSFHALKVGHILQPGKDFAGRCFVCDIGIRESVDKGLLYENNTQLWSQSLPPISATCSKYDRGGVLVVGGAVEYAGAAKLAAYAAMRAGCGFGVISCDRDALLVYAASAMSLMTAVVGGSDMAEFIKLRKVRAVVVGPGMLPNAQTKDMVRSVLSTGVKVVVDAGGISAFADDRDSLFDCLSHNGQSVLTPHEGEFKHLFPDLTGNKIDRAKKAAAISNSVVLLKGNDTVIASPNGEVVVNTHVCHGLLGTAGSGDVLSGIIAGLMSRGMDPFSAAKAGAWIHGECANKIGKIFIAEDILSKIPDVLSDISQ